MQVFLMTEQYVILTFQNSRKNGWADSYAKDDGWEEVARECRQRKLRS